MEQKKPERKLNLSQISLLNSPHTPMKHSKLNNLQVCWPHPTFPDLIVTDVHAERNIPGRDTRAHARSRSRSRTRRFVRVGSEINRGSVRGCVPAASRGWPRCRGQRDDGSFNKRRIMINALRVQTTYEKFRSRTTPGRIWPAQPTPPPTSLSRLQKRPTDDRWSRLTPDN